MQQTISECLQPSVSLQSIINPSDFDFDANDVDTLKNIGVDRISCAYANGYTKQAIYKHIGVSYSVFTRWSNNLSSEDKELLYGALIDRLEQFSEQLIDKMMGNAETPFLPDTKYLGKKKRAAVFNLAHVGTQTLAKTHAEILRALKYYHDKTSGAKNAVTNQFTGNNQIVIGPGFTPPTKPVIEHG